MNNEEKKKNAMTYKNFEVFKKKLQRKKKISKFSLAKNVKHELNPRS